MYDSALSIGSLLHRYFYTVMSQKHSGFWILIEFCIYVALAGKLVSELRRADEVNYLAREGLLIVERLLSQT